MGIETSCDDSAVAIVSKDRQMIAQAQNSQILDHQAFGGVVPEIAARSHLSILPQLIEKVLHGANMTLRDVDAFAATCGPGLIGGVHVGANVGKTLALSTGKPFLAINHLAAHALTARLTDADLSFPYLLLLTSGGHCQMMIVRDPWTYELLGQTLDDAAGEAFDKVGRLMGFTYPAGPAMEKAAQAGDPSAFDLPRPLLHHPDHPYDFSFSGLKTAARQLIDRHNIKRDTQACADLCASFQEAVSDLFCHRVSRALTWVKKEKMLIRAFVLSGGVAANQKIRQDLEKVCEKHGHRFVAPPPSLCTDNGVMIAWNGIEVMTHQNGPTSDLDFRPCPRWPLETLRNRTP